jgi:hypothetical protein
MSFIHRAVIGNDTYYRLSDSKIDKPVTISEAKWTQVATATSGSIKQAIQRIERVLKTPDESAEKTKPGKDVEAMVEQLDKVATGLQEDGNLTLAKAVDWISDIIENKVQ